MSRARVLPGIVALVVLSLTACGGGGGQKQSDAGAPTDADAPTDTGAPTDTDITICAPSVQTASCIGSSAATHIEFAGGSTSRTLCGAPRFEAQAQCSTGCAVHSTLSLGPVAPGGISQLDITSFASHPSVLCADTPEAKTGDPCTAPSFPATSSAVGDAVAHAVPCLPTRAQLNADGTVASQSYLACSVGPNVCAPAAPPVVPAYLQACDAAILAQFGSPGALGMVPFGTDRAACLLAWDDGAQAITSGVTIECVGDWECPASALCDDQIPRLSVTTAPAVAVCKPGPRGTLTPAMLSR